MYMYYNLSSTSCFFSQLLKTDKYPFHKVNVDFCRDTGMITLVDLFSQHLVFQLPRYTLRVSQFF